MVRAADLNRSLFFLPAFLTLGRGSRGRSSACLCLLNFPPFVSRQKNFPPTFFLKTLVHGGSLKMQSSWRLFFFWAGKFDFPTTKFRSAHFFNEQQNVKKKKPKKPKINKKKKKKNLGETWRSLSKRSESPQKVHNFFFVRKCSRLLGQLKFEINKGQHS